MATQGASYSRVNDEIHIDKSVSCINKTTNEFIYNGKTWVLYNNVLTMRKHSSLATFETKKFKMPYIISREDAMDTIHLIINISANHLNIIDKSTKRSLVTKSFIDTFNEIKSKLSKFADQQKNTTEVDSTIFESLALLTQICDKISAEDILKGLFAAKSNKITIAIDTNDSISTVLSQLVEYIINYTSFDESIIQMRGLNNAMDYMYTIISILNMFSSIPPSNIYSTLNNSIMHQLMELLYDTVTDRSSKELFILERSFAATEMKKHYFQKYKFLKTSNAITSPELGTSNLCNELANENISMYPHILTFTMSDNERISYLYNYFLSNKNKIPDMKNSKWLTELEFLEVLHKFWTPTTERFSVYDAAILGDIITKLLEMIPSEDLNVSQVLAKNEISEAMDIS